MNLKRVKRIHAHNGISEECEMNVKLMKMKSMNENEKHENEKDEKCVWSPQC